MTTQELIDLPIGNYSLSDGIWDYKLNVTPPLLDAPDWAVGPAIIRIYTFECSLDRGRVNIFFYGDDAPIRASVMMGGMAVHSERIEPIISSLHLAS